MGSDTSSLVYFIYLSVFILCFEPFRYSVEYSKGGVQDAAFAFCVLCAMRFLDFAFQKYYCVKCGLSFLKSIDFNIVAYYCFIVEYFIL